MITALKSAAEKQSRLLISDVVPELAQWQCCLPQWKCMPCHTRVTDLNIRQGA